MKNRAGLGRERSAETSHEKSKKKNNNIKMGDQERSKGQNPEHRADTVHLFYKIPIEDRRWNIQASVLRRHDLWGGRKGHKMHVSSS